ncbi:MAG: hypothetical protein QOE53_2119 [Pseudonocardiales bacterium]|nr:hypothetical protein [Pseudonocardiales bacterium]
MSEADFGPEVPEADRLEQLQDAQLNGVAEDYERDEPPVIDLDAANPADVLEQHATVPEDDEDW